MDFWNDGGLKFARFQNQSMIIWPGERWVYIYGTREGRQTADSGIYLMRVDWEQMWRPSAYQFWGIENGTWGWSNGRTPTAILTVSGWAGEINAQVIGGRVVLAYIENNNAVTTTAPYPTGLWTNRKVQVTGAQQPYLYAPNIHPFSTLSDAQMSLSQWIPNGFYGVKQWGGVNLN
jgi:hypothetical protein